MVCQSGSVSQHADWRSLRRIRVDLSSLRGHRDFIKSAQVPPCDYFISDPPFIVEFDESQHFSRARLITLANFPLGFSLSRWQDLCRNIDAKDDQPFDRDERRAWYDTLRDRVPCVHDFRPRVPIYAGDYQWCALDAASEGDRDAFVGLMTYGLPPRNRKHNP